MGNVTDETNVNSKHKDQTSISRLALSLRKIGNLASFNGHFSFPQSVLRRLFRHAHAVVRVPDFDGDLSIDLRLSEHMQRRIFWMGYYSSSIVEVVRKMLRSGMVVIDIGANIGEITMVAAKRVSATGKVVAFEPIDVIADELEANVSHNHLHQVEIVRAGLLDVVNDDVSVYESCGQGDDSDEHHGLGSIYAAAIGQVPLQQIAVTTLDAWLEINPLARIDLIKIDIEGSELPCLRGAEKTLRRFLPALIVEVQDVSAMAAGYQARDILDFLSNLSYEFYSIGNKGQLSPLDANSLRAFQNVLCTAKGIRPPSHP